MNFTIPRMDICVDISDEYITDLVIENSGLFCDVLMDINKQMVGEEGSIIVADKDNILNFSKNIEFIWNPISIDVNSAKTIKKLYQVMQEALYEFEEELSELNSKIVCFLDSLIEKLPYNIEYSCDIDGQSLYKAYKVQLAKDSDTVADNFLNYIKTMHQLCGIGIFLTVNLKDYFSITDLNEIYKAILYEKIVLINISNSEKGGDYKSEKRYVIDSDLCFINMN